VQVGIEDSQETLEGLPANTTLTTLDAARRALRRPRGGRPSPPGSGQRADQVAEAMARLEDLGSGNRSGPEQGQLNRYRD
jgi:hypothetical protein